MADENNENTQTEKPEGPVFRLQKMFLKDLSFESPNAPGIFMESGQNPKVDINLQVKNTKLDGENWEVSLSATASFKGPEDKTIFIIEIEHAGIFLLKNIPEEHLPAVLAVDCPTLLFPFTRQIMSQLAVDGGFMPFLMDPVNFMGLYQNARKQQEEEGGKTQ
ncbi:MAG: protein-export chaperone SecB [Desulfurivibrionaceae bacterium]|nr:protein-export chaperone SecB [Desulfurivibrionaceae bacterium]